MASKSRKPAKAAKKKAPKVVHRTRKIAPAEPGSVSENCLQMHTTQWLRKTYPNLLAFHVANERKGHVQHHVKLKAAGVLAGVADWLLFPHGRAIAIELKDDEGEQRTGQETFQKRWEAAGHRYYVVRTLAEFQEIVTAAVLFG